MSHDVRSRARVPSPSPPSAHIPSQPPPYQPRFASRPHDQLDADERKALAKSGSLKQSQHSFGGLRLASAEWRLLFGVVVLACFVRLYHLSWPNSVVFDEVHFGKFAGKYLSTRYYVDVHPPLAKLLLTMMAFFGGFDGGFDFKEIGLVYPREVPYIAMRALPAIMGIGVVPLSYLTLRGLDCRPASALLGAMFILFENGLITQSRLILLDSPLVFFTALTVFCWVGFSNEQKQEPFTEDWWLWLTLTGLSLGAVVSCKWVGLFTIATVGLCTLKHLWDLLGDLRVPPRLWIRHFLARALCLIVLPLMVYMAVFEVHFLILQNSGDGDGFMSSEFQHTLHGKGMQDTYADVALGSEITIRHINTQGGYLHSHEHNYPTGSQQQQITLYPHSDRNNNFKIVHAYQEGTHDHDYATEPITHITHGTMVRLEHVSTFKHIHSHDVRPPVSDVDFQNEVSGYGFQGFVGDANDNWVVEIEHGTKGDSYSSKRLRTLRTVFRLRHALQGCYLFSHKVKLPTWAFEQQEVTCNKNAVKANSLWYVETNEHPQLSEGSDKVNYHLPGFFGKFLELQKVMWTTNAGLTDRHNFDSRPTSWLTLKRGINFWVRDHRQVYLLGNPFVWWLSTAAIVVFGVAQALLILRWKRQYKDFNNSFVVKYQEICGFLAVGWFLHYFPFFLMSRQLFLHHYFPALYFAILLTCSLFDLSTSSLRPKVRLQVACVLILGAIFTWYHFSPLTYAGQWTKSKCHSSKWLKTWDFSCDDFPVTYDDYSIYPSVSNAHGASPTPDGAAHPHPDGQPPAAAAAGNLPIVDEHKAEATHVPAGNHPEPGRNVFQDKFKNLKDQVASVARKDDEDVNVKTAETTKAADPAEHEENKAVMPPPPLPPNELNDVRTEGAHQQQQHQGPPPGFRQPPQRELEQKEQRIQHPDRVAAAQAAAGNDAVAGADAAVQPKPADPPKEDSPAAAAANPEATMDEEEKVRKELFPEEGA
ncbi:hypothetical protein FRB94_003741 [Tulasnella sp. JGI-2019a]|nr:hypothetical protein FRB94_003741 [Tulasnella sp. JGI-2019a]